MEALQAQLRTQTGLVAKLQDGLEKTRVGGGGGGVGLARLVRLLEQVQMGRVGVRHSPAAVVGWMGRVGVRHSPAAVVGWMGRVGVSGLCLVGWLVGCCKLQSCSDRCLFVCLGR